MTRGINTTLLIATWLTTSCGCGETEQTGDVAEDRLPDTSAADTLETAGDTHADPPPDTIDVPDGECTIPDRDRCTSSTDCGGRACARFPDEEGGIRYCEPEPAEEATAAAGHCDECTTSDDCTGTNAACFTTPWYCFDDCGGPPWEYNICVVDECVEDTDCPNMCVPAGLSPWRRSQCVGGSCSVDGDCDAEPCGYCMPFWDPCCHDAGIHGYFCVYPGACASDSDCPEHFACLGDETTGGTRCDVLVCPD